VDRVKPGYQSLQLGCNRNTEYAFSARIAGFFLLKMKASIDCADRLKTH